MHQTVSGYLGLWVRADFFSWLMNLNKISAYCPFILSENLLLKYGTLEVCMHFVMCNICSLCTTESKACPLPTSCTDIWVHLQVGHPVKHIYDGLLERASSRLEKLQVFKTHRQTKTGWITHLVHHLCQYHPEDTAICMIFWAYRCYWLLVIGILKSVWVRSIRM